MTGKNVPTWEVVENEGYSGTSTVQILRMRRPGPSQQELETLGAGAIRQVTWMQKRPKRYNSTEAKRPLPETHQLM